MIGTSFRACIAVLFLVAVLVGCGGKSGFSIPTISNVVVSPTTATQNQGGGAINVNFTMDFANADAALAIASYTVNMYDQNKNLLSTNTSPIYGLSGMSSGTISGIFVVSTTTVGNYTYNIYISDNGGQGSNIAAGPFTITAP